MATDKIMVDDEEIAGVELSKEEKMRVKRQEIKFKNEENKKETRISNLFPVTCPGIEPGFTP